MTEQRTRMLADGLVAGMLGYVAVVLFFTVLDVAGGRPALHTAAFLGEAVFGGSRDPVPAGIDMGLVLAFNGLHLLSVLVFGFFSAWLVYEAELHPELWYVAFFLFLAVGVFGYAAVLAVTLMVAAPLSPWLIASAGLLSALSVAGYLTRSHRALVRTIREASAPGGAMG
jgi:hypothetical protein